MQFQRYTLEDRAPHDRGIHAPQQCDECYVSIRSYLDKSFPQLLWENVSGFLSFDSHAPVAPAAFLGKDRGRSSAITGGGTMMDTMTNREQAWSILCEFTKSEGLRKHALAVETCVAAYAEDWEEMGQVVRHRAAARFRLGDSSHTCRIIRIKGEPILAERGVDEEIRRAILSHANHAGVPRDIAAREDALRLRRTGGLHHGDFLRQAAPQRIRSGRGVGEEEDEGQSLRALREPPGHRRWGGGTGRSARRAYRFLRESHAGERGGVGAQGRGLRARPRR